MTVPAIRGFDWDHGNRDKCQKHGMSIGDIEAVFTSPSLSCRIGRSHLASVG
jgi:uncharacterized DUF497 family protein